LWRPPAQLVATNKEMYTEWPTELSPYATRILIFFPLSIMCTDLNKLFGMLLLKEVCKKSYITLVQNTCRCAYTLPRVTLTSLLTLTNVIALS